MGSKEQTRFIASCRCGEVALEASGAPIIGAVCHCESCRDAARAFARFDDAPGVIERHGGTPFLLYRKDRVRVVRGAELLREHRLRPESPTRRVVTSCCHSPMFLEMAKGHWLSMYRARFGEGAPPIEVRVMTRDRGPSAVSIGDVPEYSGHSGKFMGKLLWAWIAMGFRAPEVPYGRAPL